ncbi:MAG: LuxR C-terminal-related transcriptional regulator [Acidimicrobiales bacterium]
MEAVSVMLGGPMPAVLEALEYSLNRRSELSVLGISLGVEDLVERVRQSRPAVALVCADVPEWDGVRACAAIKNEGGPSRVVVVGGEGDHTTLLAAVRAGADGFTTVADSIEDLASALRQVSRGESWVPPLMLGALLRGLIEFRRDDDAAVERFASLGIREREVLAGIVAGLDHHAIAAKLYLSPHTARTHTQNILSKLGVHSRIEAARLVLNHDLLNRFRHEDSER